MDQRPWNKGCAGERMIRNRKKAGTDIPNKNYYYLGVARGGGAGLSVN